MPKATGKDHSQINLDIWGDEAFLDLSPAAQHLYFVLWTSPGLSYCGSGDWHPGRIATRAKGWTAANVEASAAELSNAPEIYILIDADTGEYLLRSWIKHDGLCRSPNMAVSMANARADLASRTLRGVVVHEVAKIRAREPDLAGWKRDAVSKMLTQKAIDPADLPPFNPSHNPSANPAPNPTTNPSANPSANPSPNGSAHPSANPGPTPAPTPAPTSISPKEGGYVSTEGHQGADPDPNPPPPRTCEKHPNGTNEPCLPCKVARQEHDRTERARTEAARGDALHAAREAAIAAAIATAECELCDDDGYRSGVVCDHVDRTGVAERGMAAVRAELAKTTKGSAS